jgi:small-conductance mechanosensitive channel
MWNNILTELRKLPPALFNLSLTVFAVIIGLIIKAISTLLLRYYSSKTLGYSFIQSFFKRLNGALTFFLPLLILNLLLPLMMVGKTLHGIIDKTLEVLLILSFAWLLMGLVKMIEDYVYHSLNLNKKDNLRERKIRTQLQFIRKVVVLIILVVAIGAILLSFNNLRRLGTGLLTGVGISGLIVGFAAQRSLGNLLAGFQIAFTQPIRIDDVLVVEGEWGKVEEINLTYVVLNIWDQRRLILPINYFLEKPFQNWTRTTAEILGTVFIYLDYNAPIEAMRTEFSRLLNMSELWDKRVGIIQVTNTTEQTIEVRALMSANNSSSAFDLRCFIREKLVEFIYTNHPECLPKSRASIDRQNEFLTTDKSNSNTAIKNSDA